MFEKLTEVSLTAWIAIAALVALAVILIAVSRDKQRWTTKMLASGALSIALSFILSCIRLYRMPTGGSITLGSMLPLMLFAVAYGTTPGLLAGLAYGLLQYLQGGWWLNIWQFIFDYILAFTVLGLAGIAHDKKEKMMYLSIPFAALFRAVCAILAGLMWAEDSIAHGDALMIGSTTYSSSLLYSMIYNGVYIIPDALICLLIAFIVGKQILKIMKSGTQR